MKKLAFSAAMVLLSLTLFGQNLPKGALLGLHTEPVILNPNVTMEQYIGFVKEKMIPAYEKNFPGMKVYVMKGIRGESADKLSLLMVFPSETIRDKYFKSEGGFNEAGLAASKKMDDLSAEENKYVKSWDSDKYTDWLVQ